MYHGGSPAGSRSTKPKTVSVHHIRQSNIGFLFTNFGRSVYFIAFKRWKFPPCGGHRIDPTCGIWTSYLQGIIRVWNVSDPTKTKAQRQFRSGRTYWWGFPTRPVCSSHCVRIHDGPTTTSLLACRGCWIKKNKFIFETTGVCIE